MSIEIEGQANSALPTVTVAYSPSRFEAFLGNNGNSTLMAWCMGIVLLAYFLLVLQFAIHIVDVPTIISLLIFMLGLQGSCALFFSRPVMKLDASGITFPATAVFILGPRLRRPWRELKSIQFSGAWCDDNRIKDVLFCFHGGRWVSYRFDGFTKHDFDSLVRGLTNFGGSLVSDSRLNELLPNSSVTKGSSATFATTEHWLSDYSKRFAPTAYVPLSPGDTLQEGRIQITAEIATGGLSAIYLAQSDLADPCVIKEAVVPDAKDQVVFDEIKRLFKREAELLATLDHPRIVKVYDYFIESDRHYLLMQFINGINLRAQIERWGKYSTAEALPLALEIARIIEYMHDHAPPVVHRDLTPDNFILEDDGAITLIDFGAANYFLTSVTGTIIGKAAYMPLEQFKGRPELKSDVYSFAKTIYFCTTGLEPEVFGGVFEGQSKDEFSKLMADCTQDQASDRPTIREVVMRLEALC